MKRRFEVGARAFAALLGAIAGAVPATAVDGVIEISQVRAVAGGVTPDDTPGFPVTLSQAGSYRLTGNLNVAGEPSPANVTAISITASFVTLDLNGFELRGPTTCTGAPVTSCAPTGGGDGIFSADANFVVVRNGTVRGFGDYGIHAGHATIESVHVSHSGADGIFLEFGGSVRRSSGRFNGELGISGFGILVSGSRATENHFNGIDAYPGVVTDSEAENNGWCGIRVETGLVADSVSHANGSCGVLSHGGAYSRNVVSGANPLIDGVAIGPNVCNGTGTCP